MSIVVCTQEEEAANPNIDFILISKCKAMIKVLNLFSFCVVQNKLLFVSLLLESVLYMSDAFNLL